MKLFAFGHSVDPGYGYVTDGDWYRGLKEQVFARKVEDLTKQSDWFVFTPIIQIATHPSGARKDDSALRF